MQSDPIGFWGGVNAYGYADENPLIYDDQYGLASPKLPTIVVDSAGNAMIEPLGGRTSDYPPGSGKPDTHTYYRNGSNYQRLNPYGHPNNSASHGHGHLPGSGVGRRGQGSSIDIMGRVVKSNSPAAHWPINSRIPGFCFFPVIFGAIVEWVVDQGYQQNWECWCQQNPLCS